MKPVKIFITICLITITAISAPSLEIGVVSPIQLGSPYDNVDGLRLGLFYTKNNTLSGIDINLFVGHTTGDFDGFRFLGFANITEGSVSGVTAFTGINITQESFRDVSVFSLVNITRGHVSGTRIVSTVNYAESLDGFDLGWINIAQDVTGFQMGFINYAASLDGFQIGVVNIAQNSDVFPVLPLINFSKRF